MLLAASERGRTNPDAFFELFDPDVDYRSQVIPDAQVARGIEALRAFWRRWWGGFEDIDWTWEEVIDAGHHVMTVSHWSGTGKASGVRVDTRFVHVWTFRDGKIVRYRDFPDRDAALRAAGLLAS